MTSNKSTVPKMTLILPNQNDTQFTYNNKTLPNITVILPMVLQTELKRKQEK